MKLRLNSSKLILVSELGAVNQFLVVWNAVFHHRFCDSCVYIKCFIVFVYGFFTAPSSWGLLKGLKATIISNENGSQ